MKKVVTHFNPDLDAVTATWLIVRWLPGWENAEFEFVPAGKTFEDKPVDADPEVIHVDTGLGKFDHHQANEYTCAAEKVLHDLIEKNLFKQVIDIGDEKLDWNKIALERFIEIVKQFDHFQQLYYPQPEADYHEFTIEAILDGWKLLYRDKDELVINKGMDVLDTVYMNLLSKIEAERIIKEEGIEFESLWGKGIAVLTKNSQTIDIAQKRGYQIGVRKHPVGGHVRIKTLPPDFVSGQGKEDKLSDLSSLYQEVKKADPEATWFLHSSGNMLLNGSAKNPIMKATKLSLKEIVGIIKKVKKQ